MTIFIKNIQDIYAYIFYSVKTKFFLLITVTLLVIISDMVALIIAPQIITSASFNNTPESAQAIIILGLVFLFSYLSSGVLKTIQIILQAQIASLVAIQASKNLYFSLYNKPFSKFKELDLGEISSLLGVKITRAVSEVVVPSLVVPSGIISVASLVVYLMISHPIGTLSVFSMITATYVIIIRITKRRIIYLRNVLPTLQDNQIKSIFSFIYDQRNIRISPVFQNSFDRFMAIETELRQNNALLTILSTIPRYIIETSAIIIILGVVFISFTGSEILNFRPEFFVTFLIAAQKILPLVQHTYQNHTVMKANYHFFEEIRRIERPSGESHQVLSNDFQENLRLENVKLRAGDNSIELIHNGGLSIQKSKITLIYGQSGCGKTSLLENIIGLSDDLEAKLYVDGICDNRTDRSSFFFGKTYYVSQRISCPNISVGDFLNCDLRSKKVYPILNDLQLCSSFDSSYISKMVGENGSFLSGGELQRLSLAKALLSGLEILILDEPTSAVNTKFEEQLLKILEGSKRTILMVSHSDILIKKVSNRYLISDGIIRAEK